MFRWGIWDHSRCKRCNGAIEDIDHLFTCTAYTATQDRHIALTTFIEWMISAKTSPFIMMTIIDTMKLASTATFVSQCPAQCHPSIIDAAKEQDMIGYGNFLSGRISAKWKVAQQEYLRLAYPDGRYTGQTWAGGLVRNLGAYTKLIWVRRSAEIHEDDDLEWRYQTEKELNDNIQQLFSVGISGVARDERFLFDIELERLLSLPITAKRQWIDAVTAAQDFYEDRTQPEIEIMQRFMERWRARRR